MLNTALTAGIVFCIDAGVQDLKGEKKYNSAILDAYTVLAAVSFCNVKTAEHAKIVLSYQYCSTIKVVVIVQFHY